MRRITTPSSLARAVVPVFALVLVMSDCEGDSGGESGTRGGCRLAGGTGPPTGCAGNTRA
jgi:hypothetical protein